MVHKKSGDRPPIRAYAHGFRTERPGKTWEKGGSTIFPPMTIHINTCLIHNKMTPTVESYTG